MQFNIVKDDLRSEFLAKNLEGALFDLKVFNMANLLIKNYAGGYWDYVETDTNVAFMRLTGQDEFTLVNPFSNEEVVADANLTGMIVTSYALLRQIEIRPKDEMIERIGNLNAAIRDYCAETKRMDVWMIIMD